MVNIYQQDDFNGELYVGGQEGEVFKVKAERQIVFPHDFNGSKNPMEMRIVTNKEIVELWRANYRHHKTNLAGIVPLENHKMCLMKIQLIRMGLVSNLFDMRTHHVKVSDILVLTKQETDIAIGENAFEGSDKNKIDVGMTKEVRDTISMLMTDLVGISAHVFKSRGHHWMDDFEVLYKNLMDKCNIKDEAKAYLPTTYNIFSNVLHCIFPVIKASFFEMSVVNGRMAGALIKRHSSTPAGAAALTVIEQGVNDLKIICPGLRVKMAKEFQYLEETMVKFRANPMSFSVNSIYYGEQRQLIDEQRFGALAAVVLYSLKSVDNDHPMLDSKALQRIAKNAPISGQIISKSISKLGGSEKAVAALEEEPVAAIKP